MAKIKSSIDEEPNEAFTSMIDIVFLLLIFFILQPFKAQEMRLESHLPKDVGSGPSLQAPQLNIRLAVIPGAGKGKGVFMVNNVVVPDNVQIASRLRAAAQDDPNVPVVIAPDPQVYFRHVLHALDQCHLAGMKDIKFAAPQ